MTPQNYSKSQLQEIRDDEHAFTVEQIFEKIEQKENQFLFLSVLLRKIKNSDKTNSIIKSIQRENKIKCNYFESHISIKCYRANNNFTDFFNMIEVYVMLCKQVKSNTKFINPTEVTRLNLPELERQQKLIEIVLQVLSQLTYEKEIVELVFQTNKIHCLFELLNVEGQSSTFLYHLVSVYINLIWFDFRDSKQILNQYVVLFRKNLFLDYFPFIHRRLLRNIKEDKCVKSQQDFLEVLFVLHSKFLRSESSKYRFPQVNKLRICD